MKNKCTYSLNEQTLIKIYYTQYLNCLWSTIFHFTQKFICTQYHLQAKPVYQLHCTLQKPCIKMFPSLCQLLFIYVIYIYILAQKNIYWRSLTQDQSKKEDSPTPYTLQTYFYNSKNGIGVKPGWLQTIEDDQKFPRNEILIMSKPWLEIK